MKTGIVVWGKVPNSDIEVPLYRLARTMEVAKEAAKILELEHGCIITRIEKYDLSKPPKFVGVVNK